MRQFEFYEYLRTYIKQYRKEPFNVNFGMNHFSGARNSWCVMMRSYPVSCFSYRSMCAHKMCTLISLLIFNVHNMWRNKLQQPLNCKRRKSSSMTASHFHCASVQQISKITTNGTEKKITTMTILHYFFFFKWKNKNGNTIDSKRRQRRWHAHQIEIAFVSPLKRPSLESFQFFPHFFTFELSEKKKRKSLILTNALLPLPVNISSKSPK